jgi:sulfite exporter TauE/SafE
MIELLLVFVAGMLGTAHCLGMCGPFALVVGGTNGRWRTALGRQLAYTVGRIFTYAVLGATAGYCGAWLATAFPTLINIPAVLAIAAGLLLIDQGLRAAGWRPLDLLRRRRRLQPSSAPCLAGGFLGQFLRQSGFTGALLAGLFTGLLPCGLLYGMLALASTTHSVVWGTATMAIFGMGTAPVMILAGLGGRLFSLAGRRRLLAAAAWCLVLTGVISLARGAAFLSLGDRPAAGCPLCTK